LPRKDLRKLGILIFRHDPDSQFEFGYRDLVEIFMVVVASAGRYVRAKVIMKRFEVESMPFPQKPFGIT